MPSPDDMSGDGAVDVAPLNVQLDEFSHRSRQQLYAARFAAYMSGALCFMAALVVASAMCVYIRGGMIQWQIGALVAALMVPATIIAASLVRAVFRQADSGDSDKLLERLNPYISILKEIRGVIEQGPKP